MQDRLLLHSATNSMTCHPLCFALVPQSAQLTLVQASLTHMLYPLPSAAVPVHLRAASVPFAPAKCPSASGLLCPARPRSLYLRPVIQACRPPAQSVLFFASGAPVPQACPDPTP